MKGKAKLVTLLICALPALQLHAQTIVAAPREEWVLTGIIDLSSYRRALFRVEVPGQAPQHRTMAEGEQIGYVTLITIDSHKAKVTLRDRGSVRELTLNARSNAAPTAKEQQRDAAHSAHHTKRAQLDRARDERENKE